MATRTAWEVAAQEFEDHQGELRSQLRLLAARAQAIRNPTSPASTDLHDQINQLLDELVGK